MATISNAGGSRGEATGVTLGSATITAAQGMVMGTATLTVSSAVITSITVGPANATLPRGASLQMTATANWSDNSMTDVGTQVTWSSSDPLVITISNAAGSEGVATAVAPGNVTISATLGTVTGTVALRATQPALLAITVSPAGATIARNTTQLFTATGAFSDGTVRPLGNQLTWSSSDPAVATIEVTGPTRGLATGITAGTVTITAAQDGVMGTAQLVVSNSILLGLTIAPDVVELPMGFMIRLRATGAFDDGSSQDMTSICAWSSSDTLVATVSNNPNNGTRGRVSGLAVGTTTITAAIATITSTSTVNVSNATLTGLTVMPSTLSVTVNGFGNLTAQGSFSTGVTLDLTEQVIWTSSDLLIAVVDNGRGRQGRVRGIALGMATVTATAGAITGTAAITVE